MSIVGWLAGVWLLWSVRRCRTASRHHVGVGLTVVVPARNESGNLPRLLASLPGDLTVIVVDDGSTDGTAKVARDNGATVVAAEPVADGRNGKAAACALGAAHAVASGAQRLLFLDADCVLEPGGIDRLVTELDQVGGLVSVEPYHVPVGAAEQLSAFFNVVSMMGVGTFTPRRRIARVAFGPCLLTSSADYATSGGHAAAVDDVLDDVALARAYRAAGLPVTCYGGRGTIRFRMYPYGLGQLVEGWTKNFARGATVTRPVTLLLIIVWLAGCINAAIQIGWHPSLVALIVYAAFAGQQWWLLRKVGRFSPLTALLYPIPLLFFVVVFARSLFATFVRRSVRWKGRRVAAGRH